MRKSLLAAAAALAVFTVSPAFAETYDSYAKAYQAFQQAMEDGNQEAAVSSARQAWELAEAKGSVGEPTLAVLAQNYAFVALWDEPKAAIAPAERALELGRAGHGLDMFSLEELQVMAATAHALDNADGGNREDFIEAMDAYWAAGGEATSLVVTAGIKVATIILERGAYRDVMTITKPLGETISRLPGPPVSDLASANILRVAATLSEGEVFRPAFRRSSKGQTLEGVGEPGKIRRSKALHDARELLKITRSFFPSQDSIDTFNPLLAQVLAWDALVGGYSRTNVSVLSDDYTFEWNGERGTPSPVLATECRGPRPHYTSQKQATYPNTAAHQEQGGAIIVGYHLDENGKVYGSRVLAGVPQERFGRNTLRAVDEWEADVAGVSEACRMNNMVTYTFYIEQW